MLFWGPNKIVNSRYLKRSLFGTLRPKNLLYIYIWVHGAFGESIKSRAVHVTKRTIQKGLMVDFRVQGLGFRD